MTQPKTNTNAASTNETNPNSAKGYTYAIGDIQGCYDRLQELLEHIQFSNLDTLWFTGDLVNRGPHSLATLRFIKSLGNKAKVVLGNHDFGLLAVANGAEPFIATKHTFDDVLNAKDRDDLLIWLEHQPLLHHDPKLNFTLVHAGFHPAWDLQLAQSLAKEVEKVLLSEDKQQKNAFYHHLYGNTPANWTPTLQGFERLRCIINYFTRIRFCSLEGELELSTKETREPPSSKFMPWFSIPNRKSKDLRIIFGHWAALEGKCFEPNTFALDTGCVWGNSLTALRLEDQQRYSITCAQ